MNHAHPGVEVKKMVNRLNCGILALRISSNDWLTTTSLGIIYWIILCLLMVATATLILLMAHNDPLLYYA